MMLDYAYELSLRSVDERKCGRYDTCFIENLCSLSCASGKLCIRVTYATQEQNLRLEAPTGEPRFSR
jgi:hypothetical protein